MKIKLPFLFVVLFTLQINAQIATSIFSIDSRVTNHLPQDRNSGVYFDFKTNTTDGLLDVNTYHGVMTFRPYGGNADFSGGLAHQLAFTDNGNMWLRSGSNATWLSWTKIYSDKNINRSDIDFNAKNIYANGNVGIGTTTPDSKLTVNGNIHAKEVRIDLSIPAPDYVFASHYKLKSLKEVEAYIKDNSHLPEIPSAQEFEKNGLLLAEMNMSLLKKVEELTLYVIEQEKKNNVQSKEIETLKKANESYKNLSERLSIIENQLKE